MHKRSPVADTKRKYVAGPGIEPGTSGDRHASDYATWPAISFESRLKPSLWPCVSSFNIYVHRVEY